jgi:nucleotide-binding universal stress UspA family protein
MFHEWLVADDLGPSSEAAARVAAQIAVDQARASGKQARVVLCHVVQPVPLVMSPEVTSTPVVATLQASIEVAERALAERAQVLQAAFPTLKIETRLPLGPTVRAVLEEADREHVDGIAVGSTGRHGIAHALLGSTAEKTVHKSHKSVLVVKH